MKGDNSLLGIAAITHKYPSPPPVDDSPPFPVFMLSMGMIVGKLLMEAEAENNHLLRDGLISASSRISSKKSVKEVIKLVWNE